MPWLEFLKQTSWVDLTPGFKVPTQEILKEIRSVDQYFTREREQAVAGIGSYIEGQTNWSAFTLYCASGSSRDLLTQGILGNQNRTAYAGSFRNLRRHQWTEVAALMPSTVNWIKLALEPFLILSHVKIARLEPGGSIPEHSDLPEESFDLSGTNTYTMLNTLLIELDPPVGLRAYHDSVPLKYTIGSVFWCNQGRPHSTSNQGSQDRFNLRIHGLYRKKFKDFIKANIHGFEHHPQTKLLGGTLES